MFLLVLLYCSLLLCFVGDCDIVDVDKDFMSNDFVLHLLMIFLFGLRSIEIFSWFVVLGLGFKSITFTR